MAKDDFDMDFHFDDDDFDPKAFLDDDDTTAAGEDGEDIDLRELDNLLSGDGDDLPQDSDSPEDDLDLSGLGLDDVPEDTDGLEDGDLDLDGLEDGDLNLDDLDFDEILSPKAVRKNVQQPSSFGAGDSDDLDFPMGDEPEATMQEEDPTAFRDGPVEGGEEPEQEEPVRRRERKPAKPARERREHKPRQPKESTPREPKQVKPNIFTKLYDLYIAPLSNKEMLEAPVDPNNPRRRRKKTKEQIFKEVYLPPILACLCLVLMLSFVIGAISNAIDQKRLNDKIKQSELDASVSAAAEAEAGPRKQA